MKSHKYWRSWVIDPSSEVYYRWLAVVSVAVLYNLIVIIARAVFWQLQDIGGLRVWFVFDYLCDTIYLLDMFVQLRTAYLDQGITVFDVHLLAINYVRKMTFKLDVVSMLPTDVLYARLGTGATYLRFNRLLRLGRMSEFQNRIVFRTRYPNVLRIAGLAFTIMVLIHWNACGYYQISVWSGIGSNSFVYGNQSTSFPNAGSSLSYDYFACLYWSTMMLSTIGEMNHPITEIEYVYFLAEYFCGILILATVVGNVGAAINSASAERNDFQQTLDGVKKYLELRQVDRSFELRVVSWFDYLWTNRDSTSISNESVLDHLPDSVRAEMAFDVHADTLRKVAIFKECEKGLLTQLVLKLRPSVFGPGEYVCRKGDIGKEMYIIKRGRLEVVSDDEMKVFASLEAGTVFGEISVLNIAGNKNGNRRTANIRSVGYSDVFVLSKEDLSEALKEYPESKQTFVEKGRQMLLKDNLLIEEETKKTDACSTEEKAEKVAQAIEKAKTKLGRLMAEMAATTYKLRQRLADLDGQLDRCRQENSLSDDDDDFDLDLEITGLDD